MSEGSSVKTLLWVAVIAVGAAVILKFSYEITKDQIAANRRARLLANLYSVLDPALTHEDLNPVPITAADPDLLGSDEPVEVFVVTDQGRPVATIFATVAPNGYNAAIYLLVGVATDTAEITGVRAISHRETPGLGDLIEIEKSDWIRQFDGKSVGNPALPGWALAKETDEGEFDAITGATVTPRAVVRAVRDTLLYFDAHKTELFAEAARVERETPAVE
jgi:electron transport complex protein RnfG